MRKLVAANGGSLKASRMSQSGSLEMGREGPLGSTGVVNPHILRVVGTPPLLRQKCTRAAQWTLLDSETSHLTLTSNKPAHSEPALIQRGLPTHGTWKLKETPHSEFHTGLLLLRGPRDGRATSGNSARVNPRAFSPTRLGRQGSHSLQNNIGLPAPGAHHNHLAHLSVPEQAKHSIA